MRLDVTKMIETIKTSTGDVESTFSLESVCDKLIQLSKVDKELQSAIKVLKDSVTEHITELPFENDDGLIKMESRSIYEQDIKALEKALPKAVFYQAANIVKSRLSEDKEELKKLSAIVDLNSHKTGESSYIKVTIKGVKKAKGTINVE